MTEHEINQLARMIAAQLAAAEARIERIVNERTTNYANSTQAVVGGLHEDVIGLTHAVEDLSASIAQRRVYIDERLALAETQIETLADLVPDAAVRGLPQPPLRAWLAALDARGTARWQFAMRLFLVNEVVQWLLLLWLLWQVLT